MTKKPFICVYFIDSIIDNYNKKQGYNSSRLTGYQSKVKPGVWGASLNHFCWNLTFNSWSGQVSQRGINFFWIFLERNIF